MILGYDVSHHNPIQDLIARLMFIKASEGKFFKDPKRNDWVSHMAIQAENTATTTPYIGFYHFARPDLGTSPIDEVKNFVEATEKHRGFAVALDWENKALTVKDGEKWALEWLENVEKLLHTTPMFYVQASSVDKYPNINARYPLWVACYSQDSRAKKYKTQVNKASMLQITSHPLDIDVWLRSETELVNMITTKRWKPC